MNTTPQPSLEVSLFDSPLGTIVISASDVAIHQVLFDDMPAAVTLLKSHQPLATDSLPALMKQAHQQLGEYFSGQRQQFTLPLAPQGTPFQHKVWAHLCTIPYAVTWSYLALAQAIKQPSAARAVGMANGKNPLSIIVPCHRVIGKNQQLTGYAGGVERKAWLLAHETQAR
jgi:methylated-DNA-[protein]-cysteine S-methyltransferase